MFPKIIMKGKRHMAQVQRFGAFGCAVATAFLCIGLAAQTGDPASLVQQKLVSQINLTKVTADRSDIVTAGDIVVLQKDGLMMCSTASAYAYSNTYDNGVLTANQKNRAKDTVKSYTKALGLSKIGIGSGASASDSANNGCPSRKFVAGEKFWVTGIVAQKDGILVITFSDPYDDVRYYGEIKFPFAKGHVPPVDDFVKTVSEVITVQPAEAQADQGDQGSQPAAAPEAPAPPPDIAPPPLPADTPPPTIALHQTKDEVIAVMGQPIRIAKLGVKEIFYYKDMKVTFTNGKVSNIE
jgi:hypothetical protein